LVIELLVQGQGAQKPKSKLMKPSRNKLIVYSAGAAAVCAIIAIAATQLLSTDGSGDSSSQSATPGDATKNQAAVTSGISTSKESPAKTRTPRELLQELSTDPDKVDPTEIDKRSEEIRATMRARQMDRFTNQAAKWSAVLGLEKSQQEQLMDIAAAQLDELDKLAVEGIENGDPTAISESARRAMELVSGQALNTSLAGMLTPEQRKVYEEFSVRQNISRAESGALRQLAGLNEDLMLSPEQRNQVYGIFYEQALANAANDNGLGGAIDNLTSSAGLSVDPAMKNILSSVATRGLAELASGRPLDPQALEAMARETMKQSVDKQVEGLRGVLDEAQLEFYRTQLNERMQALTGESFKE
jgi:hypothetical protein